MYTNLVVKIALLVGAWALLCVGAPFAVASTTKAGVALVIGNNNYVTLGQLSNPINDAKLIGDTLSKLGFDVMRLEDATQIQMRQALDGFGKALAAHGKDAAGVFFYSGHGVQMNGDNFLIPVDARIQRDADIKTSAMDASRVLAAMEAAKNRINFVILDACRDSPFKARGIKIADDFIQQATAQGFAKMDAPHGMLIAYSTQPGNVALDGGGNNSPYTQALANGLLQPNMAVERMFRVVRNQVMQATNQRQVPWEHSSLTGDDYFFNPGTLPIVPASPVLPPASQEALSFAVDFLTRPAHGNTFRQLTDGDTLGSGDLYRILIRPEAESYVYIFQAGSTGAIDRLFPMTEYAGRRLNNVNPMRQGVTYYLPAKDKAFYLDNNPGKEAIYVFVSPKPRPDVEDLSSALASAQAMQDTEAQAQLMALFKSRDLPLTPSAAQPGAPGFSFSQNGQTVETIARSFRSACATCVHVLEFQHR